MITKKLLPVLTLSLGMLSLVGSPAIAGDPCEDAEYDVAKAQGYVNKAQEDLDKELLDHQDKIAYLTAKLIETQQDYPDDADKIAGKQEYIDKELADYAEKNAELQADLAVEQAKLTAAQDLEALECGTGPGPDPDPDPDPDPGTGPTPVPEPSALWLFGSGLLLMTAVRRLRRRVK